MQIINVKFISWDNAYDFLSQDENGNDLNLKIGEKVLVETVVGTDIAEVVKIRELDFKNEDENSNSAQKRIKIKPIIRVASEEDLENLRKNNLNNNKLIRETRKLAKRHDLEMKMSDAHISYDNTMMVFSFIADGRVDFRELVKSLSRKYKKKIRLFQIGVRDEAKFFGDVGDCGRGLCCRRFLSDLESITTGFARDQQVSHRGLDKLSGVCGRLKCCLAYEEKVYQEKLQGMPQVGGTIKTKDGPGIVIDLNPLKRIAKIRLRADNSIIKKEYD